MHKKPNDSVEVSLPSEKDNNQSRTVGLEKKSSDFDRIEEINPFTQMSSNPCGSSPSHGRKAR
jgi:hypothetical protein